LRRHILGVRILRQMTDGMDKICQVCGRRYSRHAEFRLMRLEDGSRAMACARCRSRPAPGGAPAPWHSEADELAKHSPAERRRHPRRSADLVISFTRLRDERRYSGILRDLSQGGVRFTTGERLGMNEVINVVITGRNVETRIRAVAQVVRITKRNSDYEVGVRFTGRGKEVKLSDRRDNRRVVADFEIRYRREGHRRANVGRVRDISQGGIRFVTSENIPRGEVLSVTLDARAAGVIEAEMKGTLRVSGSASVLASSDVGDRYEVRAKFV